MSLTQFQSSDRPFQLMQSSWANQLDPVLALPPVSGVFLKNISLSVGANTFNHTLGRMQQGWILTDVNAAATIFRSAPMNATTLTLTSNAACTVNLWVY